MYFSYMSMDFISKYLYLSSIYLLFVSITYLFIAIIYHLPIYSCHLSVTYQYISSLCLDILYQGLSELASITPYLC